MAGLQRSRLDLLHRTVTVEESAVELTGGRVVFGPPKTAAGRRAVSVPAELLVVIEQHLAENVGPGPNALVFTDHEGQPLGRNKFRPIWAAACAGAGISGLHFHDLRGSGATWAAAPVKTFIARLLGVRTDERAWRVGAKGEQLVAAQLERLGPTWHIVHSVTLCETGTDLDHLAIGPGGVFCVNTKSHPNAKVWVDGDTVLVNGHRPEHNYVRASWSEGRPEPLYVTVLMKRWVRAPGRCL